MIHLLLRCKQIYNKYTKDEMIVYAAQASFFSIIAAFPFIMLLLDHDPVYPVYYKSKFTAAYGHSDTKYSGN